MNGIKGVVSALFTGIFLGVSAPVASADNHGATVYRADTTAPSISTVTYTVLPVWYAIRIHRGNSTVSPVVGTFRANQKLTGTISSPWVGWLRTSKGFVNLGVLNVRPTTPKNGVATTLNLCAIPVAFNTPHKVPPNYTATTPRLFNCNALPSLVALENAYQKKFKHYAQIDLAYRSYAEQQSWYNKLGYPTAAKPGTSNHGWGLAIDFSATQGGGREFQWGGVGFKWLKANAHAFGFNSPFTYGTPDESYHWDFNG